MGRLASPYERFSDKQIEIYNTITSRGYYEYGRPKLRCPFSHSPAWLTTLQLTTVLPIPLMDVLWRIRLQRPRLQFVASSIDQVSVESSLRAAAWRIGVAARCTAGNGYWSSSLDSLGQREVGVRLGCQSAVHVDVRRKSF